jgi:hypothetical protein
LYAAVTKSAGARVHAGRGNVDWPVVGLLAAGSLPAAMLTLALIGHLPPQSPALARTIATCIGLALFVSAASLLFPRASEWIAGGAAARIPAPIKPWVTVFLGFVLGVLVSLTSVGAGAVGIAVLRHLYPDMPAVRLAGSDIAHAVPLTLVAGTGHWLIGDVQLVLLGSLLLGSIPGICIASHYAHRIPDAMLRRFLGALLLVIAIRMLAL